MNTLGEVGVSKTGLLVRWSQLVLSSEQVNDFQSITLLDVIAKH